MRREARAARGSHAAKFLPGADDMHGRRICALTSPVRDSEGKAVNVIGPLVAFEFVVEETEKRHDPRVARDRGAGVSVRGALSPPLEGSPQRAGVGKNGCNLVRQAAPAVEAEVGGPLAGQLPGQELIQNVRA